MTVAHAVTDQGGYQIDADDLDFLKISDAEFASWASGDAPLRVSHDDYRYLCKTLFQALEKEGIDDADVRLQGSAARFFSSPLKPMLYSRAELVREFLSHYRRMPSDYEADRMEQHLASRWSAPGPTQRPFDALFVIGAAAEASDLDFQISSHAARSMIEAMANDLGLSLTDIHAAHPHYNFFRKELTETKFVHLSLWRTRAAELIRRPVSIAIFDGDGPPMSSGAVSSHFQSSDWMVEE
ncbi:MULTISPECIES: hypothetical protein [unclassified Microbacterium]|uniref:hypothetical protein n=1 Tax=unclassified Microbacterium TaxID=2609290 RepID=UPI00301AF5F3